MLDKVAAISPWMWNRGMMLRQRSSSVSASVLPILPADAVTLRWDSGTIFGREVVPEVCSTSAMSPASAKPPWAGLPPAAPSKVNRPAGPFGSAFRRITGTFSFLATAKAGDSAPSSITNALALRSDR